MRRIRTQRDYTCLTALAVTRASRQKAARSRRKFEIAKQKINLNTPEGAAAEVETRLRAGIKDMRGIKLDYRKITHLDHLNLDGAIFDKQALRVSVKQARKASFDGANILAGSDLSGAALTGASLKGATLTDVKMANAGLAYADASGLKATGTSFEGIQAQGSKWDGAHLNAVNICAADLSGSSMRRATMTYSVAEDTNWANSRLSLNVNDVSYDRGRFNDAFVIMKKGSEDPDLAASFHGADFKGAKVNDQVLVAGTRDHARQIETVSLVGDDVLDEPVSQHDKYAAINGSLTPTRSVAPRRRSAPAFRLAA